MVSKELKEVKDKLNRILNSNTPSSQLPFTERNTNKSPNRRNKGTNPRGKPKGSNGDTRKIPKNVDRKLKATADKCPSCKSKQAKGIIDNWLKQFEGQWFVGVMMPEVELTNNRDERGIRKVIPTRKNLGGHRTEEGAEDFAIIETHRQTWKLKNKSPYTKLINFLTKYNAKAVIA